MVARQCHGVGAAVKVWPTRTRLLLERIVPGSRARALATVNPHFSSLFRVRVGAHPGSWRLEVGLFC